VAAEEKSDKFERRAEKAELLVEQTRVQLEEEIKAKVEYRDESARREKYLREKQQVDWRERAHADAFFDGGVQMIERLTASLEEKTLALSAAHDGYSRVPLACTGVHCGRLVEIRCVQHCTAPWLRARRSIP